MADNQSIFDVLNISQKLKESPNRYYLCVKSEDQTVCYKYDNQPLKENGGVVVSVKQACPEIFDTLTVSYKVGKKVTIV
jgi:hypothetical protein